MTELEPFGTIKACPACGAKESWGDGMAYATYPYPTREFKRQYMPVTTIGDEPGILEESGYITSTCWRCGYTWSESALNCVEENDED